MSKLELIEIEENYFSFSGTVEYYDDGKKVEKHTDELFETFKHNISDIEINIECLSLNYKVKDFFGFFRPLSTMYSYNLIEKLSENHIAALYQILFYAKKIDKRIINIFCSRRNSYEFEPCIDGEITTIPIDVYEYGYNNRITIFVDIATFLNIIKEGKLSKHKQKCAIDFFKKEYNVDIENTDSDYLTKLLLDIKKYEKKFDDLDRKKMEIKQEEYEIAKDYYKNKLPFEKDDFVFDMDSVFKIKKMEIYEKRRDTYNPQKHPVESRFYYSIYCTEMIGSGESKKNGHFLFLSENSKIICSESDYHLLSKKYNLTTKPNKHSLIKILKEKLKN